ncbi:MAG: fibronectin type III domain-containing protein, partial [Nocardioidaceae bacterium]
PLMEAFLNPPAYNNSGNMPADQAAGMVLKGMSQQVGNEIDEFVTEALRNNLLGLPLDLATINMARARDTGTPTLNEARRDFYAESNNSALQPYTSWGDLWFNLKHEETLANFVAAYGTHPDIEDAQTVAAKRDVANAIVYGPEGPDGFLGDNPATNDKDESADDPTASQPTDAEAFMNSTGAWANQPNGVTTTGVDDIDLWVGGLAEKQVVFGGLLGSTFNYVFELQMEDLQFGDRFYYLSRTAGLNLLTQLEGNSFAELITRNTDASGLPADVFSRPDFVFNLENLGSNGAILNDATTEDYDESDASTEPGSDLSRIPGAVEASLRYAGPAHTVFNGTAGADRMWASEGDDTIRGGDQNDWMQGGDGVDNLIGGLGNDIMNDLAGDDTLFGGDGHDAMSSGQGFAGDLNQGGRGNDFIVGGNDTTETLAGPGDDLVYAGDGEDEAIGGDGSDWLEGGAGPANAVIGDNGAPFEDNPNGGHDVLDGNGGTQDFHAEGGDDVMLAGPGIQLSEGMLGFDWFTHKGDPQAGDSDLNFTGFLPPGVDALRDRFLLAEGLSGWNQDDVLRGDDRLANAAVVPGDVPISEGHALDQAGIDRIPGMAGVLGGAAVTSFDAGNIILGGDGSDTLEGRGGDDILDGDRWLDVQLRAPNLATPDTADTKLVDSLSQLREDVFAGRMNGGDISIVRSVKLGTTAGDIDTALFNDVRANYTCTIGAGAPGTCPITLNGTNTRVLVTHNGAATGDGTDTLRQIERLAFSDTVAPETPSIETVAPGNGSATLTWLPAAVGVTDSFTIDVLDANGNPIAVPGEPFTAPGTATSMRVTGLTNGTTYRFAIQASNSFGDSPFSQPSVRVTPGPVAPDAPTIGTAEARNGGASVAWTAPAENGGQPITGYVIRVLDNAGVQVGELRPVGATPTTALVTGLTNGQTYRFEVAAENSRGRSAFSAPSNIVTAGEPGAPVIGTASAGARGGATTATARWSPPASNGGSAITGYRVRALLLNADNTVASTTTSGLRPASAGSFQMGLPAGRYRFEVRAFNAVGGGTWSAPSNIVRSR